MHSPDTGTLVALIVIAVGLSLLAAYFGDRK